MKLAGGNVEGSKLKRYSDSQDERNTAIKVRIEGLTIKNGFFTGLPGGVVAYSDDLKFENIILTHVGEDGISNAKEVKNTQVINCKFYGNAKNDKLLQLNGAIGAIVKNCLFVGGITAIRCQESSSKNQGGKPRIEGNSFKNVDTAVNASGRTTVYLKNNTFEGVRLKTKTDSDQVKFIEQ